MRNGANSGDLGLTLSPSGRGAVDFGRVGLFLVAAMHLVEGVEASSSSMLTRRRRAGRVGIGGLIDHITMAKEGSVLKSVEVVAERKGAVELGQCGEVDDIVEGKEDGEVGDSLRLAPPRMEPRSSFIRVAHDVDGALHELAIG